MVEDSVPIYGRSPATPIQSRRRDLVEILFIYGLVLLVFWTPPPWRELLWCVAAAAILFATLSSFESLKQLGLCRGKLSCSLWAVAGSLVLAAIAVTLAARMHTLHLPGTAAAFIRRSSLYVAWAAIQEIVLQCFFLSRLLRVLGDSTWAAAAAAMLFALAHLPSPILMGITLLFGLAGCLFFLRYRSLYPIAIAHAILGIAIAVTIPGPIDHNMEVGLGYFSAAASAPLNAPAPLSKP